MKDKKTELARISEQLRHEKARLRHLSRINNDLEKHVQAAMGRLAGLTKPYPAPPLPNVLSTESVGRLPEQSGVYFLWNGHDIEYVGKAVNLSKRVKLRAHNALKDYHSISFLLFAEIEMDFAESYYIGLFKPVLNFKMRRYQIMRKMETA